MLLFYPSLRRIPMLNAQTARFSHQNVRNIAEIILYFTMIAGGLQVPQTQKQAYLFFPRAYGQRISERFWRAAA